MVQFWTVLQEPMGRLFTTEEERRVLNELRDVQKESSVEESDTVSVCQTLLRLDAPQVNITAACRLQWLNLALDGESAQ